MQGIDANETYEFTSEQDKAEPKMVFVLGVFSNRQKIKFSPRDKADYENPDRIFALLKAAIKEVRCGGEVVKEVTDDFLDYKIPFEVLLDVSNKVLTSSFLNEDEKKN